MRGASSIFHRVYAHESRVPLQMETNLYTTRKKKEVVVALVINRIERLFYFFLFFISLFFFLDLDRTTFFTHELLVTR